VIERGDAGDVPPAAPTDTASADYTERLDRLTRRTWKQRLDVQRPYRWNARRLNLGRVLDVGCGIGRNLSHLDGNGVGIDHNPTSVAHARERGFTAYTPEEFRDSPYSRPHAFDSLLLSHVVEHISHETAVELLLDYLPCVRASGRVVFICPQERGWVTDPTHVRFVDFAELEKLSREAGLSVERSFSFPLPRAAGRVFPYNEFVVVARLPAARP
jgi:SAM-dependent methyltransferase